MSFQLPGASDVHVDRPLTNISIAYIQKADGFVADRVFPRVPVSKQSDKYFEYDRGYWMRDEMKQRAPSTESAGMNYGISSDGSYSCDVWALHVDVADQVRSNADSPIAPDREAAELLAQQALLRKEKLFVSNFFGAGIWTSQLDGVAGAPAAGQFRRWDEAAATPIEDVRAAKRSVQTLTGFRPNKIVLGRAVYDALLDHPDIVGRVDRGQTNGSAVVMRQNVAALFELDDVLVMDAIENTAAEGAANSFSFIGGKHALLVYAAPAPSIL
ncbi:MAG: hypothetical protein GX539_09485, partial [Candidatus Cloacimonetes bacterium]|nr:hypothetical protein [Candidatus Cloacimonadota bacterium]